MTCVILCPILYIVAGLFNLLTICTKDFIWTMVSTGIFLLGLLIFTGLFGAIMVQVNIYNREVLDEECDVVKERLRVSGLLFIVLFAYSFFLTIFAVISNISSMHS